MSDLTSADAIVQTANAEELEEKLVAAFADRAEGGYAAESRWAQLGARAKAAVERRCGVVARCVGAIRQTLAALLILCAFAGCSREDGGKGDVRKTCEAVKSCVRGIYRVETAVAVDAPAPRITPLDVDGLTAAALLERLAPYTNHASRVHLWMPGEKSWLLVEHAASNRVNLAWAMNAAANDPTCTVSVPEVFASYVGTLEDVLPAFASKLEGAVVPEWFVTKEIPKLDWLDVAGVDADILKMTRAEIRSMQVVRRLVLEGTIASRKAKEKGEEKAATDKWASAYRRNPHDSMLLERMGVLERNARGFLGVGKVLQAMKCYETLILINPNDAVSIRNFGLCLKKIGRLDMAKTVLEKAKRMGAP